MQTLFEDKIITKLAEFARSINKKIYVVGGAVRDALTNRQVLGIKDIDLTGNLTYEEVKSFLITQNICYEVKNRKLEVIAFNIGNNSYEYARMRKEEYLPNDTHTPTKVSFVDEITEDAKRRDFTVNSVYYDRHSNRLFDPVGGIKDIEAKSIRPVLGEETLKVDPARIIRFIELKARHDFEVSDEVYDWVKKYAKDIFKLTDIRLNKEVDRLMKTGKYQGEDENYIARVKEIIIDLNLQNVLKKIKNCINI